LSGPATTCVLHAHGVSRLQSSLGLPPTRLEFHEMWCPGLSLVLWLPVDSGAPTGTIKSGLRPERSARMYFSPLHYTSTITSKCRTAGSLISDVKTELEGARVSDCPQLPTCR
jgi:hypothetical protein